MVLRVKHYAARKAKPWCATCAPSAPTDWRCTGFGPPCNLKRTQPSRSRSHHYTACISVTSQNIGRGYHDNNTRACESPTTTTHLAVGAETHQAVVTTSAHVISFRNYPAGSTHAVRHTSTAASGNKEVRRPKRGTKIVRFRI